MKIIKNKPFKELTTFKVGGPAGYFVKVKTKEEVKEAAEFAKEEKLKIFVLGGGSDILVSDKGLDAVVVTFEGTTIEFEKKSDTTLVTAQAGMIWDDFVEKTVEKNLQGVECLSGIPGSVGASPIQNIGAYGQELKDAFIKLTAYDFEEDKFVEFNKKDCEFSYRESVFKRKKIWRRYVIIDVTLELFNNGKPSVTYQSLKEYLVNKKIDDPSLLQVRESIIELRRMKLENPDEVPNAGSFFKNPVVGSEKLNELKAKYPDITAFPFNENVKLYAGWLIDKAGWKGKKYKTAAVSSKNALVIINPGNATATDIKELSNEIEKDVYNKFGIRLEREVQFIGFEE